MKGFLFLVLWMSTLTLQAQSASSESSDPKARTILDKLKKEFDSYKTMEIDFEINMEFPGRVAEVQKGRLIQDGQKYRFITQDQEVYADGKTMWVYLKKNKEVQILDVEENAEEFMSPKQILAIYQGGDYIFSIADERTIGTDKFVDIEFKPASKKSEFAKIRLTIDKNRNKMSVMRVFAKDGSRYTLTIKNIKTNLKYDASLFTLNPKTLSGVRVEDLRFD
jgi:outer membrane lipoprotein-sorting protein